MPELLAVVGLAIGIVLYAMLIRRRASVRSGLLAMTRALAASNEMALQRLHLRPSSPKPAAGEHGDWRDGVVVTDRRSGKERRGLFHRRFGRGRRSGGDRRRS